MSSSRLISLISFLFFFCFNSKAQSWSRIAKSGNAGLIDVVFLNKAKGFVISEDRVLESNDSGKSWTRILSSYSGFSRIKFIDNSVGYIIGKNDLVLKTVNSGTTWSLIQTGNSDDDFTSIYAINKDTLFVVGSEDADNSLYSSYLNYSYNGGNNWFRKSLNTIQDIPGLFMWNKNLGILGTKDSGIFSTQNGFQSYTVNPKVNIKTSDIVKIRDSVVLIVGSGGDILRSIDFGKNFSAISSPITDNLNRLHFCNDSVGMACGDNGTIIMTNDAGKSWTKMNSNTSLNFTGIYVLNPYLAWAVAYSTKGDSFDIFRFEDKTCLSSFVKVPRDTVICDKYDYLTKFQVKGLNKPTWMVNDALTNLYHINDSTAQIKTVHEGKFIISFELQSCENAVYDTATVYFWRNPTIRVYDSLYCGQVDDNISFSCFACSYLWNGNDNSYNFKPTGPGKYWVKATNLCGSISDTFTLSYLPYLTLNLGNDTLLCNNEILNLKPNLSPGNYLWDNLDTNSTRNIRKAGEYSLSFKNKCNDLRDTIRVSYKKTPVIDLGKDSIYCLNVNHPVDLDSVSKVSNVRWWDSSTVFQRTINTPGLFYVTIKNECGTVSDTIKLGLLNIPQLDLGKDTTYCEDFKHVVTLNPKIDDFKIEWWDASDSLTRTFSEKGIYKVRIYNRCGQIADSLKIDRLNAPLVYLGKDTFLSKPFVLLLDAGNAGSSFKWNTSAITQTLSVSEYGEYWVNASNYCGISSDTIVVAKPLTINERLFERKINAFPNPLFNDKLMVQLPPGIYNLQLFNTSGQLIQSLPNCFGNFQLDMEGLLSGTYYLLAQNSNQFSEIIRIQKN